MDIKQILIEAKALTEKDHPTHSSLSAAAANIDEVARRNAVPYTRYLFTRMAFKTANVLLDIKGPYSYEEILEAFDKAIVTV